MEGISGDHLIQPLRSEQGQLEQITLDCAQLGFEHLQGWKFNILSGQELDYPQNKKRLFLGLNRIAWFSLCAHCSEKHLCLLDF